MQGLAQKNNLSDLLSPVQARANLGLADADYKRVKGLYAVAGLSNLCFQRIAGATGNFQAQLNAANSVLAGVDLSLYALRSGDVLTGVWSNAGFITAGSVVMGGVAATPASDPLFSKSAGSLRISALSSMTLGYGLNTSAILSEGNIAASTLKQMASTMPISVSGTTYRIETT